MQDALEKKIEKFSSANVNVQKRVSTSSKFRNNTHMMLGSLNKSRISSKHGPGTSGGNGVTSGGGLDPISKKKYSLGSQFNTGGPGNQDLRSLTNRHDTDISNYHNNLHFDNSVNDSFNIGSFSQGSAHANQHMGGQVDGSSTKHSHGSSHQKHGL